jgi:phosphatidylinositol glycan class B
MNRINSLSLKNLILISLGIHIWAAFFSSGFQHFDEHFQILEFVNLKWGGIEPEKLAWEFREKIRPWFQPWLYYVISVPFKAIGIETPFFYVFLFRLITGLFGWFACIKFLKVIKIWFKENESLIKWSFFLLNFLWYIPFIHVRTSSESLAISLFMLGTTSFLLSKKPSSLFLAGIFWGLAYHARFQMALPVAFVWFHGCFFDRNIKKLSLSAAGVIVAILLGTVIDYWGYGEWSFSLWHYYRTNFLEGIMAKVKHYPSYWYVRWGILRGVPPVSLVLIAATIWGWVKMWRHPLTWMTLPLFIFHSLVGHKEVRYLFPTMVLAPLFLLFYYDQHKEKVHMWWEKRSFRYFINLCLIVNVVTLVIASTKPVNPSVNFYSYLWDQEAIIKIYAKDESPFTMLGLDIEFYKKPGFEVEVWNDEIDESGKYVFLRKGSEYFDFAAKENCKVLFLAYPEWILHFNVGNWLSRSRVWSLFKCN